MIEMKEQLLKVGGIVVLRLCTGEEIITKIKGLTKSELILINPFTFFVKPDGQIGIMPSTAIGDDNRDMFLNRNSIVLIMHPKEEVLEGYEKAISAIQIPGQKILVPTK